MRGTFSRTPIYAVLALLLGSCFDDEVKIVNTGTGGATIVTIAAVDANGSESGDAGTFAVSRAGDPSQPLTVTLTVSGTATEGTDYGTLGTTLIIPAGALTTFLAVTPTEDIDIEPNETVQVAIAAGTGYTVGAPASATVTIVDNDNPSPIVTISAVDANGSESGDVGSFAVTRAGDPSAALTVNLTIAGTATNGTDYTTIPATVSIPSGAFVTYVTVTPTPDASAETNETVQLTVAAGVGYAVGAPDTATVTIVDINSTTPVVSITALDAAASESGDVGTFAVLRAGDSGPALTINLTITGTAASGTDYTALAATVAMPSGSFLALLTVAPLKDLLIEGNETVIVTVAVGGGYAVGAPSNASVTIADVPPTYHTPEAPVGIQSIENEALAADLGSDGEPRLIYSSGITPGNPGGQIRLVRRRTNGTWTDSVAVSSNNNDFKKQVTAFVSRSNNHIHVFWLQGPASPFNDQVYYAQFTAGDPPAVAIPAAPISTIASNRPPASTYLEVYEYQADIDRTTDSIAAIWTQNLGGVAPTGSAPIAGIVVSGAGPLGEQFMLANPSGGAPGILGTQIYAGPGAAFHALYGTAFHRMRTGVGTWTAPTGIGASMEKTMVVAPDGDAYVICAGTPWVALYRPTGAASAFSAPQNMPLSGSAGTTPKIKAVLEPGTEHLHVFAADVSLSSLVAAPVTAVHPAPNLSGSWGPLVTLHTSTADDFEGDFEAFADASNTVTVVFRAPEQSGDAHILARSRPTGAASAYGPLVNLSALAAFPMTDLSMAQNASGNALVTWRQGGPTPGFATTPPHMNGEIYARRFVGGTWSAVDNVSQSSMLDSVGPTIPLLSDGGVEHVFWNEYTSWNLGAKDVFYSSRR